MIRSETSAAEPATDLSNVQPATEKQKQEPRDFHLGSVVLKIAGPCNLNCGYCYVYNHEDSLWKSRPKQISDEIFDAFLERVVEYCESHQQPMSITFHGGEPTLVGTERFASLAGRARNVLGSCLSGMSIQTNGTLLTDEWARVLDEHGIGIGVSLDGPPEVHDEERVYHNGAGSSTDVVAGLQLLQNAGLEPYVLSVLSPALGGQRSYDYFRSLGVDRFDLLLPDVSHDNKERFYGGLGPTPVAEALIAVIDRWLEEDDPNVHVRTIEDLVKGALGGGQATDAFGNAPMGYIIVETDGAIEALDALRVCGEGISSTGLNVLTNRIEEVYTLSPPTIRSIYRGYELCGECKACPEVTTCGGGYLPHRYSEERGFDNPSVWCADIKRILAHIRGRFAPIRNDPQGADHAE